MRTLVFVVVSFVFLDYCLLIRMLRGKFGGGEGAVLQILQFEFPLSLISIL